MDSAFWKLPPLCPVMAIASSRRAVTKSCRACRKVASGFAFEPGHGGLASGLVCVWVGLVDGWMGLLTGELLVDAGCHMAAARVVDGLVSICE